MSNNLFSAAIKKAVELGALEIYPERAGMAVQFPTPELLDEWYEWLTKLQRSVALAVTPIGTGETSCNFFFFKQT